MQVPEGYRPVAANVPFWQLVGPFYERDAETVRDIALLVQEKHGNIRGVAHGGVIATLADIALGYNIACATGWKIPLATVSLTTDYSGAARVGDWLEAKVDLQKLGRNLMFANTYIHVGDKRIARASGVFSALNGGR